MLFVALLLGFTLCTAKDRSPPSIKRNSVVLNAAEITVPVRSSLSLTCEGDSKITWSSTAFKRMKYWKLQSEIQIPQLIADYTGTYTCAYDNQPNLTSEVHIYVNDPHKLLVTPRNRGDVKEGSDLLLCQLTDPSATELSLHTTNGDPVPSDVQYVVHPKRDIVIKTLAVRHSADYFCSAKINGVQNNSEPVTVTVTERLRSPPSVLLELNGNVHIVGEMLKITCFTSNPNYFYNHTLKHSYHKTLNVARNQITPMQNKLVQITSTVTIPAVAMSHTGNFTCTAMNEAGANSSTAYLQVVDKPYIRLKSHLSSNLYQNGSLVEVNEGENLEITIHVEAYPQIKKHWWDLPVTHNMSTHQNTWVVQDSYRYKSSLLIHRVRSEDRGQYTLYTGNTGLNRSITFNVQVYQKPSAMVIRTNATTLTCTSAGYPAPTLLWYQCPGIENTCVGNNDAIKVQPLFNWTVDEHVEELGPKEVTSELALSPSSWEFTVECVSFNLVGEKRDVFKSYVPAATTKPQIATLFTPTFIGATSIAAVLLLLLVIVLYKYKQKPKYEVRWKIIETNDGNNYTFIDPAQLPYNKKWEFPRDKLKLGQILGAGAFGKVVEATAYGLGADENKTMRVAVKMLKPRAHSEEKEALMSELKILSHLGCHDNIVNLLGACTQGGPMLMITEYCSHGDLLNFLRDKAKQFLDSILSRPEDSEIPLVTGILADSVQYKNTCTQECRGRSDSGISSSTSDYQEMHPAQRPKHSLKGSMCEDPETDTWSLDIEDMLNFSFQVAQGMNFLASKNCIHRDVAARNVLLTDGRVAKICDFGLARDVENDSNYVVKGNARLPVKWMAPESIFDCVYTTQSDVWSYGILLWEIFSLGKSPYPNVVVDTRFYQMIKDGCHMSQPDFAPEEIYTIMKMCWIVEPTVRPTFNTITQLLQKILLDQPDQTYRNVQETSHSEEGEHCSQNKISADGDQSLSLAREDQPLIEKNNYQFC
ncbi:hypothetical protein DPEC_G00236860 [Dallia pectoralis]|uniref:Uncharacterized protein n=1 Tax=Dallia pectoralis TaxID=75939 RepID=A0ACC2FYH2_DALPE|nr:hypothetical protein DPEC_G00236860 [Dallia pectoralis]